MILTNYFCSLGCKLIKLVMCKFISLFCFLGRSGEIPVNGVVGDGDDVRHRPYDRAFPRKRVVRGRRLLPAVRRLRNGLGRMSDLRDVLCRRNQRNRTGKLFIFDASLSLGGWSRIWLDVLLIGKMKYFYMIVSCASNLLEAII